MSSGACPNVAHVTAFGHPGDTGGLYVGDEQGTLSAYRVQTAPLQLTRWRRQPKAHSLGITRLLLLAQEHLLVSASYDNTVRLFDTQTGSAVLTINNMNKCRFSALCWDQAPPARREVAAPPGG